MPLRVGICVLGSAIAQAAVYPAAGSAHRIPPCVVRPAACTRVYRKGRGRHCTAGSWERGERQGWATTSSREKQRMGCDTRKGQKPIATVQPSTASVYATPACLHVCIMHAASTKPAAHHPAPCCLCAVHACKHPAGGRQPRHARGQPNCVQQFIMQSPLGCWLLDSVTPL